MGAATLDLDRQRGTILNSVAPPIGTAIGVLLIGETVTRKVGEVRRAALHRVPRRRIGRHRDDHRSVHPPTTSRKAPAISNRPVKLPDASHPITVTPTTTRVRVYAGETVIADTTKALTLQESTYPAAQYVPLADIDPVVLSRTDTSTYCPFKGDASYYSVTTDDGTVLDAGWTYEAAYDAVAEIKDHVAWYGDRVRVVVDRALQPRHETSRRPDADPCRPRPSLRT